MTLGQSIFTVDYPVIIRKYEGKEVRTFLRYANNGQPHERDQVVKLRYRNYLVFSFLESEKNHTLIWSGFPLFPYLLI